MLPYKSKNRTHPNVPFISTMPKLLLKIILPHLINNFLENTSFVTSICKELSAFLHLKHAIPSCKDFTFNFIYKKSYKIPLLEFLQLSFSSCHIPTKL